jgi:hypothetical protein
MKKSILLPILFLFYTPIFGQIISSAVAKGLAYKIDYDSKIERAERLFLIEAALTLEAKAEEQRRVQANTSIIKDVYSNIETYPKIVYDGFYNVYLTNNFDFCLLVVARVKNNRIMSIHVDENKLETKSSTAITKCKAVIDFINVNTSINLFEVYFLENIANPNARAQKPKIKTGIYTFYCSYQKAGPIEVSVDGEYVGTIKTPSPRLRVPRCGTSSDIAISFPHIGGRYNFVAESENDRWTGTITIIEDKCGMKELAK